jgi:hypothetical protein
MAEQTEKILCPDLSAAEKTMLLQTINTPGWKVVVKITNEACLQATQDIIRLNPESQDYERVNATRAARARTMTEFSNSLMKAVYTHADAIKRTNIQEDKEIEDRVASMYGIHPARPEDKGRAPEAIKRTFGIHPAKPKSKSPEKGK